MTAEHTVKDPVCGMSVNPHSAEHRSEHGGKTWYFCSSGCKSKFDGDPGHYLSGEQKQDEPVAPGTMYTCPSSPAGPRRLPYLWYGPGARAGKSG